MFREGLLHARYCFRCEDRSVNKPNPSCKSLQSRAGDRHKQGSQHIGQFYIVTHSRKKMKGSNIITTGVIRALF